MQHFRFGEVFDCIFLKIIIWLIFCSALTVTADMTSAMVVICVIKQTVSILMNGFAYFLLLGFIRPDLSAQIAKLNSLKTAHRFLNRKWGTTSVVLRI